MLVYQIISFWLCDWLLITRCTRLGHQGYVKLLKLFGVHQDGLVHISQMTDRFIRHPLEAVSVGDIVDVQVLSVDAAKKRIALTMKISGK